MSSRTRTLVIAVSAIAVVVAAGLAWLLWPRVEQPSAGASVSVSPSAVDPSKVSPTDLPTAPSIDGAAGAIKDATFGSCATGAGKQEVTGKVTSSAAEATDYVVTISWVNATSDVLARGVAVLKDVGPGEAKDFTIKAEVPDGVTTCTFHVVRGRLG